MKRERILSLIPGSCGLLLRVILASLCWQSRAYRIGDAVDVIYRTPSESMDALRHQMPLFGVPSVATFDEDAKRFSLTFEDGGRPLPWIDLKDGSGRTLLELSVTFVYSKSGVGAIHSISSKTKYESGERGSSFRVQYEWVEEAAVDLGSGTAVMLLATCIVAIFFLLESCFQTEGRGEASNASHTYGVDSGTAAVGASVPKWD